MRLKMRGSHLTCKVANRCLDVPEQVEVVKRNKDGSFFFSVLSRELSLSVKENSDRKKIYLDLVFGFLNGSGTIHRNKNCFNGNTNPSGKFFLLSAEVSSELRHASTYLLSR